MSTPQPPAPAPLRWNLHDTHPDLVAPLREKLAEVVDPEIGLSAIQLGLVRQVTIADGSAKFYVLLTTPFCPYAPALLEMIRSKGSEALGMPAEVELGFEQWDLSMMEDPSALDWGM